MAVRRKGARTRAKAAGEPFLDLSDYVPYWLASLSRLLAKRLQVRLTERAELSIAEWRLMAVVACNPDAYAIDVCRLTRMDDVAISRAIKRLVERGLLEREEFVADRRRKHLRLTPEGLGVYQDLVPDALAVERDFLSALDESDRHELKRMLSRLMEVSSLQDGR